MAQAVGWKRALRWPLAVALALLVVVLLVPSGALVASATASRWVLALALAVLAVASTVLGAAISAALDD